MNGLKQYALYLALLCVYGLLASCTHERQPCLTPKIATLNIECVHYPTDSATTTIDTALAGAVFAALTDNGVKAELFPVSANFTISLSPTANKCQWLMATDSVNYPNACDTLSFYYQRKLQFLSNACGYADFYAIDSVRIGRNTNNIDSILVTNTTVNNNVNTKHLKIFIHHPY